ncbi:MAG TPA: GNAT family N-acetyltransferase [Bacteroidota bacterium]|nr:GNAT family N-acetyltransferase [Bacteroidota bacterium]
MSNDLTMMNADTIVIRKAELSDINAITEIYNEAILTTTATFDTDPKTNTEQLQWFQVHGGKHPILVATRDKQVIGWVSLSRWSDRCAYDDTGETSFYVKSEYRGQGIGRKLHQAIIDEARQLKYHTLIARVAGESAQSLHILQSLGFIPVGTMKEVGLKFGRRLDVHVLQKMLD